MITLRTHWAALLAAFFCLTITLHASGPSERPHGKGLMGEASAPREAPQPPRRSRINTNRATRPDPLREGHREAEPSLEERGEAFFDRGGIKNEDIRGDYYWTHEKFFEHALLEARQEMNKTHPHGYTLPMLKQRFMGKVSEYHHTEMLTKGVERYKREHNFVMTLDEFDAVRRQFLNQNPPEGDTPAERQNIAALKGYYRRQLKNPRSNKDKLFLSMARRNWTLEDIKPYTLPSVDTVVEFVEQYRAARVRGNPTQQAKMVPSTCHVAIPLGRSHPEIDLDLNATQRPAEEDDPALSLHLYDLNIEEGAGADSYQGKEDEDDDEAPYNAHYHNPYPGAYKGGYDRATYKDIYGDDDSD